jgi:hypothetical protein
MHKHYKKAVAAINEHHVQLVYPIQNAREPRSLWHSLHPRSVMKWDWSEHADPRIVDLWHLKDDLCHGRDVVYAKWFRGRATFFSREIFVPMLGLLGTTRSEAARHDVHARRIHEELLDNSPQTPKLVRQAADLSESDKRGDYERGVKLLWEQLLIVGTGEVDEGQFPALAMGATRHIFEDLWDAASSIDPRDAEERCRKLLPADSPFSKFFHRLMHKFAGQGLRPAPALRAKRNA